MLLSAKGDGARGAPIAPTLYALASLTISSRAENTLFSRDTSSSEGSDAASSVKPQISTGQKRNGV